MKTYMGETLRTRQVNGKWEAAIDGMESLYTGRGKTEQEAVEDLEMFMDEQNQKYAK